MAPWLFISVMKFQSAFEDFNCSWSLSALSAINSEFVGFLLTKSNYIDMIFSNSTAARTAALLSGPLVYSGAVLF